MTIASFDVPVKPWYRHRWPWLLMIGPAWVLVAGSFVGYLAASRPDAMVVDDYYRQGKAINQDLRRDRVAAARAIDVALDYGAGGGGGLIHGVVRAGARPLAGALRLRLIHPTQPERDIVLDAVADGQGAFVLAVPALADTRWQVQIKGAQREWKVAAEWRRPAAAPRLLITAR